NQGQNALIEIDNGTNHIRFTNMEVRNNTSGQLVSIGPGGTFNDFIDGKYHDANPNYALNPEVSGPGGYCFYIIDANNTFTGMEVYNCTDYGFHLYSAHAGIAPNNTIIRDNYIHNIRAVTYTVGAGVLAGVGDNIQLYNNVVVNNAASGI